MPQKSDCGAWLGLEKLEPTLPLTQAGGPSPATLSRISAHRPDWLAAAWTACIAVGVEDFPPRSLGAYRTCPDVFPGQWDMSGVPEARSSGVSALDGNKMGPQRQPKTAPKTMRSRYRRQ